MYEQKLAKLCKTFKPTKIINTNINRENLEEFIEELQKQYDGIVNYNNDLTFAYYVCDSVINMVLNHVFSNKNLSGKNIIAYKSKVII